MVYKDNPALKQMTVLEAQWTDCPEDVYEDIRNLWQRQEFGNDNYYYQWGEDDFENEESDDEEDWLGFTNYKFPALTKYLRDNDINECLIHFWW